MFSFKVLVLNSMRVAESISSSFYCLLLPSDSIRLDLTDLHRLLLFFLLLVKAMGKQRDWNSGEIYRRGEKDISDRKTRNIKFSEFAASHMLATYLGTFMWNQIMSNARQMV